MTFPTARFLNHNFGSPDGVVAIVGQHWPRTPNKEAVKKWFARDSIPAEWWPVLLIVLEREGGSPVCMSSYVKGEEDVFA